MGTYICFYVLPEEVSLMIAKQGTYFDYSGLSLGVILLIFLFFFNFQKSSVGFFPRSQQLFATPLS